MKYTTKFRAIKKMVVILPAITIGWNNYLNGLSFEIVWIIWQTGIVVYK